MQRAAQGGGGRDWNGASAARDPPRGAAGQEEGAASRTLPWSLPGERPPPQRPVWPVTGSEDKEGSRLQGSGNGKLASFSQKLINKQTQTSSPQHWTRPGPVPFWVTPPPTSPFRLPCKVTPLGPPASGSPARSPHPQVQAAGLTGPQPWPRPSWGRRWQQLAPHRPAACTPQGRRRRPPLPPKPCGVGARSPSDRT